MIELWEATLEWSLVTEQWPEANLETVWIFSLCLRF